MGTARLPSKKHHCQFPLLLISLSVLTILQIFYNVVMLSPKIWYIVSTCVSLITEFQCHALRPFVFLV